MIIGVTGHRPKDLGIRRGLPFSDDLLNLCQSTLAWFEPDAVVDGVALGLDLAIAAAAKNLGIPLIAAVPYARQDSVWQPYERAVYAELLEYARCTGGVHIVCDGDHANWKLQRRNEWIVNRVASEPDGFMVALWSGKKSGGTYNCIGYANRKKVPVTNIWPDWAKMQAS